MSNDNQKLYQECQQLADRFLKGAKWIDNKDNQSKSNFDQMLQTFRKICLDLSLKLQALEMADMDLALEIKQQTSMF